MRHHDKNRKLGRVRKVRVALLRSLARALVQEGNMTTTIAKGKEIRPYVERLVTLAKNNTVASRRLVAARLGNDVASSKKLHDVLAPQYKDRPGGYIRITKLGTTKNPLTDKVRVEFV